MTDKELNTVAKGRGFKTPATLSAFRAGYTGACNGKGRDEHAFPAASKREIAAWQSGFDLLAEQKAGPPADNTPHEHTIAIDGRSFTVIVQPLATGFDVTVPIAGGTATAYGDTEEIALAAARDLIAGTAQESTKDPVTTQFILDVEVGGATYEVTQRDYASGRFDLRVGMFPAITVEGGANDDQVVALERIQERIAAHLGMIAEARTVDGERAKVITDLPGTLPLLRAVPLTPEDWLTALAEKQARVDCAERALAPFKRALKDAQLELDTLVRQAAEAGALIREPSLPLGID